MTQEAHDNTADFDDESDIVQFKSRPKTAPKTQRFRLPPYLDADGEETAPGEVVTAIEPKQAFLFNLSKMALNGASAQDFRRAGEDAGEANARAQIEATDNFIDGVFDEASAAVIRARLDDPNDRNFDVDDLQQVSDWMQGLWSARPTGKPSGSGRRSSGSGRRSTVGAR